MDPPVMDVVLLDLELHGEHGRLQLFPVGLVHYQVVVQLEVTVN